jgi:hypothetical protein
MEEGIGPENNELESQQNSHDDDDVFHNNGFVITAVRTEREFLTTAERSTRPRIPGWQIQAYGITGARQQEPS